MFGVVESSRLTVPLWSDEQGGPTAFPNNSIFLRQYVANLLARAFPNLSKYVFAAFLFSVPRLSFSFSSFLAIFSLFALILLSFPPSLFLSLLFFSLVLSGFLKQDQNWQNKEQSLLASSEHNSSFTMFLPLMLVASSLFHSFFCFLLLSNWPFCCCFVFCGLSFLPFRPALDKFVEGLFSLHRDLPAFKSNLRDFLIQYKVCHPSCSLALLFGQFFGICFHVHICFLHSFFLWLCFVAPSSSSSSLYLLFIPISFCFFFFCFQQISGDQLYAEEREQQLKAQREAEQARLLSVPGFLPGGAPVSDSTADETMWFNALTDSSRIHLFLLACCMSVTVDYMNDRGLVVAWLICYLSMINPRAQLDFTHSCDDLFSNRDQ